MINDPKVVSNYESGRNHARNGYSQEQVEIISKSLDSESRIWFLGGYKDEANIIRFNVEIKKGE